MPDYAFSEEHMKLDKREVDTLHDVEEGEPQIMYVVRKIAVYENKMRTWGRKPEIFVEIHHGLP